MQAKFPNRLITFLILISFSTVLLAQETNSEKRIKITIHGKATDGSKVVRTLIKTGADAENFDVNKYVKEHSKDLIEPTIMVDHNPNTNDKQACAPKNSYAYVHTWQQNGANRWSNKGFLGVSPDENDKEVASGAKVRITRNSGADKAGLRHGDIILQLNETPINTYEDLSRFMRTTKANDKVQVKYIHNGETQTTTATLGRPEDAWRRDYDREKEACLGVYTSTFQDFDVRGARISSFTTVSAAQEEKMERGDVITAVNGIGVQSHQELWDEIAKYKPRQIVTVSYSRDDVAKKVNVSLKACRPKEDEDVILVKKSDFDAKKVNVAPVSADKQLKVNFFSVSPNPTQDIAHIRFEAEAVPTTISLCDLSGKVLYQQILTDFNGQYNQRFDLNDVQKGVVLIILTQGDKVFSKQIVVN
jgi:membrane-associated protease RseP (regulator of RpoE activity)